jgi:hypothetical protein
MLRSPGEENLPQAIDPGPAGIGFREGRQDGGYRKSQGTEPDFLGVWRREGDFAKENRCGTN